MVEKVRDISGRLVFWLAQLLWHPRAVLHYFILRRNEKKTYAELIELQERLKRQMEKYWRSNKSTRAILERTLAEKLTTTKGDIRHFPTSYYGRWWTMLMAKPSQTGGSTGEPLRYHVCGRDRAFGFAVLWRGWGRAGYRPGDRMAVIAGGSLVAKKKSIKSRLQEFALNQRKFTSYGMSEADLNSYAEEMCKWRPQYLRGYATSVAELARHVVKKNINLRFNAVFTTAEMLFPYERTLIESAFQCKVYDTYGLNDGGISAFQCPEGAYHIDMERALLEVVDESGDTTEKAGRIIATSFQNKATMFLRYETGDIGRVSNAKCGCGSPYPILEALEGRVTDTIQVNGRTIGGPILTVLMSKVPVERWQVIKRERELLVCIKDSSGSFNDKHAEYIEESLKSHLGPVKTSFSFNEADFVETPNGKFKVVVDLIKQGSCV